VIKPPRATPVAGFLVSCVYGKTLSPPFVSHSDTAELSDTDGVTNQDSMFCFSQSRRSRDAKEPLRVRCAPPCRCVKQHKL
jgi:hypothetical protein